MSTTPSVTHSRTSSTSSTRSSSPIYRLFPRPPKSTSSSHTCQTSLQPYTYAHQQATYPQPQPSQQTTQLSSTHSPRRPSNLKRRHTTPPSLTSHSHTNLTTSIERATLPMLAHLNHQLHFARLEAERARVRAQIQRQETVLALSMLLKGWGGEECSRWSDDEDEEEEEEGDEEEF